MSNDKIDVFLNKKSLLKDYQIPGFEKAEGTMAIGFNNLQPYFSDLKMSIFTPPTKLTLKKKLKMKGEEGEEEEEEGESSADGADDDENEEEEEETTDTANNEEVEEAVD